MAKFRALHQPGNPFVMANAWDMGSARMLEALGAQAIATSSGAHAFTLGRADMGTVTRDEALSHASDMVAAVNIAVSGDFENGFGDGPETCADTVRMAAEVGLAGICIEDIALPSTEAYGFELAVERIRAASAAARALPRDFFLVARADGVMNGRYDIDEALRRVVAFEDAGADGIYVPHPKTMDDLARICAATRLPVNALAAGPYAQYSLGDFGAIGVARVSIGAALARTTHKMIHDIGQDMLGLGNFSMLQNTISGDMVDALIER